VKIKPDCLVCLFRQTLDIVSNVTDDEEKIKEILDKYAEMLPDINFNQTAPEVTERIQSMIKKELNILDPFKSFKEEHIKKAEDLYPAVKKELRSAPDTLKASLIISAIGNSIDAGINLNINVDRVLKKGVEEGFVLNDFELFQDKINKGTKLLLIADNSGEAVFDRLLIKELLKLRLNITYVVREEAILNDITFKEAEEIGINKLCRVISSGSKAPGLLIDEASDEMLKELNGVDIIISKGQGNYEALSETNYGIFYLLKAKCNVIANEFDVNKGSLIFKYKRG